MNHLSVMLNSPFMYLGALSLRGERQDFYDRLISKLDVANRQSIQSVREIFVEWAEREKERGEVVGAVYEYIRRRIDANSTFADALQPFIDNDEYLILCGGERRGDLMGALGALSRNVEAKKQMYDAVVVALWIPVLGIASYLLLSTLMGIFFWPEFMRQVPLQYWPTWTLPLIDTQMWTGRHWIFVCSLSLLGVLYATTVDRWTGRGRVVADRLPPWSTYKGRLAANTLTVLAALVGAGMSVREAFEMIRDRATPYLRWHMNRILRLYDRNSADGIAALRAGLFSKRILDRVMDASSGRTFEQTLSEVGERSLKLVVRALRVQAASSSLVVFLIVAALFVYSTMVVVLGIQDASDAYTKDVQRSSSAPAP